MRTAEEGSRLCELIAILGTGVVTREASNLKPRREFLRLAAFTGAAALTGKGVAAAGEQNVGPQAADSHEGDDKMEFLRVSGRHIVDGKGKQVRLRGNRPGGWMNMEDFINGHPGAKHTLRAQMAEVLGRSLRPKKNREPAPAYRS